MSRTQRKRIEFGERDSAKQIRARLDDKVLHDRDDAREAAVVVDTSAIDDRTLSEVRGEAVESLDSRRGKMAGQASLTDAERKRIDFTETTVPEAQTAKASLQEQGIDDWSAFFDPTLTTSEMASIAKSTQASGGQRMDQADTERAQQRRGAQAVRREKESAERHARDGCKSGFDEACEELADRHGVAANEIREIRPDGTAVMEDGRTIDASMLRSGSHGRLLKEPPQPAPNVEGYRKASSGRFVGFDVSDPSLARDADTGQLVNTGPERAISRRELRARYGHHNTGERNFVSGGGGGIGASRTDDTPPFSDVFADVQQSEAVGRGVSIEPDRGVQRVETAGVTGVSGIDEDEFRGSGFASAGGARTGSVPEPEVQSFATGRGADMAFVSAEEARTGGAPTGLDGDPFDMTDGDDLMTDSRGGQSSLDVGRAAGVTEDRTGQVAGAAGFHDRREELGTSGTPDTGMQAGLIQQETSVGDDGQTDLFGGDATESSGGEYKI